MQTLKQKIASQLNWRKRRYAANYFAMEETIGFFKNAQEILTEEEISYFTNKLIKADKELFAASKNCIAIIVEIQKTLQQKTK